MRFLRSVLAELFGMFVDDGSLALAILAWVAVIAVVQSLAVVTSEKLGALLFLGLGALLVENVLRRSRKSP